MQKFIKGNTSKKIILILVMIILFNFTVPNYSNADIGGVLFDPIRWLVTALADAAISVLNYSLIGTWIGASEAAAEGTDSGWKDRWAENSLSGNIDWPTILISPEEIFANKVLALNVNFLSPITDEDVLDLTNDVSAGRALSRASTREDLQASDGKYGSEGYKNSLSELRIQISKWYRLIRNLSAAALFCVLIYIGIRVIISSVSEERAKYKAMLVNWVAAICLVFFLHYIMALIMYVTEQSIKVISSGLNTSSSYEIKQPGDNGRSNRTL